jgi:undecaprenyl phosphate N,N'-diacetylbacillosamine 1-phosphate transferase
MYNIFGKRALDIVLVLVVLTLSIPVIILVAVAIKLESSGPVFFTQDRTGLNGRIFKLKKFRSMTTDNDVHDLTKNNQLTRMGKFLRSTSLDEIPQCINVLTGEMSFIGPRPWIVEYYKHMNKKQRHRVDVRPGITGLAQVRGRNNLNINEKINYDLEYVKKISFKQDIKIILLSVKAVFEKDEHTIDKRGIENELNYLRNQNSNNIDSGVMRW